MFHSGMGLVRMAESLGETESRNASPKTSCILTSLEMGGGIAVLLLVYFYAHYGLPALRLINSDVHTVSGGDSRCWRAAHTLRAVVSYFSNLMLR